MKDLYHSYRSNYCIKPQTLTTTNANGSGIDLLGYQGALIEVHLGAVGALQDGTNKCVIGFFDSSDNSTFTACSDSDLIGGNNTETIDANAEANSTHQRTYIGDARYVTVQIAVSGTISLPVCAAVVRALPIHAPIA
jgi:hypothetical protein